MIRLFFISFLFISGIGNTTQANKSEIVSCQRQLKAAQSNSLLVGIQSKIYTAFMQGLRSQNTDELTKLSKQLGNLYKAHNQNLILYWHSYLQYYLSNYYLEKGDRQNSEKEIDKGTAWMENMENKNSEDYALLSMLQGFGIQFKGMEAMFISIAIKKNAKKAIALDPTNLRAYYVYASNDFYTPEKYGGGKEAEKYLLKAISLPAQKIKNDYLPSWGKEESYEMLIKLYIKKGKLSLAKKYFQEGIKEFPKSYAINQLAGKLAGK